MLPIRYRPLSVFLALLLNLSLPLSVAIAGTPPTPSPEIKALMAQWDQAFHAHKLDDALHIGMESREKARPLHDRAGEVEALTEIGLTYAEMQKWKEARAAQEQALALASSCDYWIGKGDALLNLGTIFLNTGRPGKALDYFKQAVEVRRAAGDRVGAANYLLNIGNAYNTLGKKQQALSFYEQGVKIRRITGDKRGEAYCLNYMAELYLAIGQNHNSGRCLERALKLFRALGDRAGEVETLFNLSEFYDDSGQTRKSLDTAEQALRLCGTDGDQRMKNGLLIDIGFEYYELGDLQKSMQYNEQALSMAQYRGDVADQVVILLDIGAVYRRLGQPEKALAFHKQALAMQRKLRGLSKWEAVALKRIGLDDLDLHQPRRAIESFNQAVAICFKLQETAFIQDVRNRLAWAYIDAGQPQQALRICRAVMTWAHAHEDRWAQAEACNFAGLAYRDLGRPCEALNYLRRAVPGYHEAGDRIDEAEILTDAAMIEEQRGRPADAEHDLKAAIKIIESIRSSLGGRSEDKISYLASHLDAYHRYIHLLLTRHDLKGAFALAQKTKARALVDLMSAGRVDLTTSLSGEERRQERALHAKADELNGEMITEGVKNEPGARKRFADLKLRLAQAESALRTWYDAAYARHPDLARKSAATTITLDETAKFIPSDTALLEYIFLHRDADNRRKRDEIALFVVTGNAGRPQIAEATIPIERDDLIAQVDALRTACSDPRKAYVERAQAMYRLLIPPAAKQLIGKKHLILCPDGPLWDVPFATLLDRQGRPLLSRYELSYGYSATGMQAALLATNARRRTRATHTLLVMANPAFGDKTRFGDDPNIPGQRPFDAPSRPFDAPSRPFDAPSRPINAPSRNPGALFADVYTLRGGGLYPLPGTQREAEALQKDFPDAAIYTGEQAQEATVKREAGGYRYLHFATHGFFNDAAPMYSSIVLAQPKEGPEDGFLTAQEIFDLNLNAEMVVLSACNTARGEKRTGEGMVGLTWALFVAGAPSQVLSEWSVDDTSTATFMEQFYGGVVQGKSKATALRQAALDLMEDGQHGHPYYWAPFILMGDWRP
jgi:CHAT domain-containing protein